MINFCTLFDSNYLDKALALLESIRQYGEDIILYALCFDDKSYNILNQLNKKNIVLVKLSDFETKELLRVKKNRTPAEYCWTCTAASIEYMIKKFNLSECTYIDADLYFFSDPHCLFEEIYDVNADSAILEHRFKKKTSGSEISAKQGKYCVEFNYFKNNENGLRTLLWWKNECIKWCFSRYEPAEKYPIERYGDQKYLEQFPIKFKNVHEIQHLGAGVAPWNIGQYTLVDRSKDAIRLKFKPTGNICNLVFYHFQNLKYINSDILNINSQCNDKDLKRAIYIPYLKEIEKQRMMLQNNFNIHFLTKKSYSGNPFKAFIQKNLMPFYVRNQGDIVNLKQFRKQ